MARVRSTRSDTETRAQEPMEGEEHELAEMSAQIAWETECDAVRRQEEFSRRYRRPLNAEFTWHPLLRRGARPSSGRGSSKAERPRPASVLVARFNRVVTLLETANPALLLLYSQDAVAFRLGEIVYRYREREFDSEYVDRIRAGVAAADKSDTLIKALKGLDAGHVGTLMFVARKFRPTRGDNFFDLIDEAAESLSKLRRISQILSFATGEPIKAEGRPCIPYVLATCELASLWEELTLSAVVYPKVIAKGLRGEDEAVQPSTQFIYLALKMIAPPITVQNAMTCLKHVFTMRSVYDKNKEQHIKRGYSWLRFAESYLNATAIGAGRANSVRVNAKRKRSKRVMSPNEAKQKSEPPDLTDLAAD
jgi:hypothetical protein